MCMRYFFYFSSHVKISFKSYRFLICVNLNTGLVLLEMPHLNQVTDEGYVNLVFMLTILNLRCFLFHQAEVGSPIPFSWFNQRKLFSC